VKGWLNHVAAPDRRSSSIEDKEAVAMTLRSFLYLLGASLTIAGCFFPWTCRQVGELSWQCPAAITLRYSMQDDVISRLEIQDNVRGGGFIILFLTVIIVFLAFSPPQFIRRPKIIAMIGSAALVLVSAYHFVDTLAGRAADSRAFAALASLALVIVCIGALLMLVAGSIDQRAIRRPPAVRTTS
jgi:hypothetical protein